MRESLPIVWVVLGLTACGRTVPEEFSSQAVGAPGTGLSVVADGRGIAVAQAGGAGGGRCILATPSAPPAPVAPGPAFGCPPDPEIPAPGTLNHRDGGPNQPTLARVAFPDGAQPDGGAVSVRAEVVRSQHDTMRGLMYRTSLAEDRGMLFDLGSREDHKFWMHNTCIPLDLLYIDDDGLIVGIVENAPTLNDEARGVGCPSSFVLEVGAGWSRRHGVRAGQRASLPPEVKHP